MQRRALLASFAVGTISVGGCLSSPGSNDREQLPDDCPTSQDVGVEWPRDLDESRVESFIERYEETYYRQHVIDTLFEPESRLFGYSGWISRIKDVTRLEEGGWRVHFSGIVNIQRRGRSPDSRARRSVPLATVRVWIEKVLRAPSAANSRINARVTVPETLGIDDG